MIISHDLGTTGNKATLVSDRGEVIASCSAAYVTEFGPRGKAEQDPKSWWAAVCAATRELLDRTSTKPSQIEVVSFSGQMMGAVLVDGAGVPTRPAIIWADTRSIAQTAVLVDRVGLEQVYLITGHRLNPTYSLSKIMWVRDNEPEAFARAQTVLLAKDFVVFQLTGVLATDPSDASSTNDYDQSAGGWSADLLSAADLRRSLFRKFFRPQRWSAG
jgi:xylulokinase